MGEPLLQVTDLKTYFMIGDSPLKAVDGVSFRVNENETLGLVGESGCGKSITGLSILRLVPPPGQIVGGKILFKGRDIVSMKEKEVRKLRGREISMILQDPQSSLNPLFPVGSQVGEALAIHTKLGKTKIMARVIELLKLVRIAAAEQRKNDYPHQLSGGMKQRVAGAIAISCQPSLLIADEPTTSLDVTIQLQYLELLKDLQRQFGMAMIFITHDFGIVATICDRVAVMYAGKIIETALTRDIFDHPAHHYTDALLKSVPKLEVDVDRLASIPGQPPTGLDSSFVGCRFAPRCAKCSKKCVDEEPQLVALHNDRSVRCWYPKES
ncbi:MAG: ABC transporter ATP-binding protein [Desulfobacteraceae bacterium]|nr:ABC transporter ATP-binding protein [Desulfobacteraceae bacterium]